MVPSYYQRYYYAHDEAVRQLGTKPSRAAEVAAMERQLLTMYADPSLYEKPAPLAKRGGAHYSEAAVDLAAALLGGGGTPYQVVNTYNRGTLPFLPEDAVIEVQAAVGAQGASPLPVPAVDQPVLLGAGVLAAQHSQLNGMITDLLADRAPKASPPVVTASPVLGAVLLGLDRLGARKGAQGRLRAYLGT